MKELIGVDRNLALVATKTGLTPAVELVLLYSEPHYEEDPLKPSRTKRSRRVGAKRFAGVPSVLRDIAARLRAFADEAEELERSTCQSTDTAASATRTTASTSTSAFDVGHTGIVVG